MQANKIENYSLWIEIKENNNEEVKKEMIIKHLSLVKYHAGRLKVVVPAFIDEDDLINQGIIGLIDAINKFNYKLGLKFTTYASKRVRGEMLDYIRKLDWLPHTFRSDGRMIKGAVDKLTKKLGRKPNLNELAEETNLSLDKIKNLYQKLYSAQWVSLYADTGDTELIDLISGETEQPENVFQRKERENILAITIDKLDDIQKMVITLFYYEELSQKEIAEVLDLSAARVSQIHKKAVNRLRGFLSKRKKQLFD